MGLIKAAMSAVGGTFSDQWKEFFYCDAMPADVLVERGHKQSLVSLHLITLPSLPSSPVI